MRRLRGVSSWLYPLKNRDLQLDTVANGMLGYGKYVSESTSIKIMGENVTRFPLDEQRKYVLRDAELVIRLIERNDYEIFNILRCIAEISGIDFKLVCHAGVGKAWEVIIHGMIQTGECKRPLTTDRIKKRNILVALFFSQNQDHISHQLKSLTEYISYCYVISSKSSNHAIVGHCRHHTLEAICLG